MARSGVIVGSNGRILRTTTGGGSWSLVSSPTTRILRDVQFISPTIAVAVGDSGYVLKSTDAGATWQKQNSGTTAYLYSVPF